MPSAAGYVDPRRPLKPAWFDPAPLIELVEERGLTRRTAARLVGVSERTLLRYKRGARVRWDTADRASCALGLHPSELWPEWWLETAAV